jgi:adenosylhomocysteine nucleosidase
LIGIFAALRRELKPIKASLTELNEFREAGVRFSVGHLNQRTIVLIQTGIGWDRAISATQIAAARFPLKLYVSTGFAAALQDTIRVGDLVIGQKVLSLPPLDRKVFICDGTFTQSARAVVKSFPLTAFSGSLITVRKIVNHVEEKRTIARESHAIALDMETAAVANVAEQRGIPFMAVRAVTDALEESLGVDVNLFLSEEGTFRWLRGIRYLLSHPIALHHLDRLRRQANLAAASLELFFQEFLPSLSVN